MTYILRLTLCNEDVEPADTTSVPAEPDTTLGGEEPLAYGITASSEQDFSLREEWKGLSVAEKSLQHGRLRLARELEVAETEKGGQGRLKVLHDKIISEEENQKADVSHLRKLDATRAEVESRVETLEKQLKEGGVVASAAEVEKDEAAIKEQQVPQVRDEVNDQVAALLKKKAESLETVVTTLKEKLEVQAKEKEEAECAKQDALKEVSHVKMQVECLQAAEIILKDELKREKKDKEESQRVAKDLLSDLERAKVHNQHQLLDFKREAEELRAKLEEVQQLESERRAETEKLRAKQIENEGRLKDRNAKLVESKYRESERKNEIERLLDGQIEAERRLKNKEAKLKELQQFESKRRAETGKLRKKQIETERRLKDEEAKLKELEGLESKRRTENGRLREKQIETERRLKDEEEKMSRAKKEWDIKMEKAQKEMCKFVADAKLQAIDLQKQISSLREAGVSKRKKAENEKAGAPKHYLSSTAGVIPSEELRLVATTEQLEDTADAALEVKRLAEEVLTLETALAQSREIDVGITAKLRESEDQAEQLKQQLESYHGLQEQSEKRIEELNQSFQSSQKLYKQSLQKVHTLEVELTTCRLMLQSMVDRELEAKNEKKAWSVEKLELEHTVQSLKRKLEALSLVVKENEETAKEEAGGAAALLKGALMGEEKLRNELAIAVHKQKSTAEEVKRVEESCINREMEAKTSAEMLSKGFMQATLAATVALSEVEALLVNRAIDGEPPGASSHRESSSTCRQFLAKISSLGKGNGVSTTTTTTSRTDANTINEIDDDACNTAMDMSFEEDSEKMIDLLKSETLKLSSNAKEATLKLINDSQSHGGVMSCLRKKICDSEERERTLNAAVQRGAEKFEALQAELLDSKAERDTACMQLSNVSRQLQHAEQKLVRLSSSREDSVHYQPSSSSLERLQAKTVTAHSTLEEMHSSLTLGCGGGSCSSELHDWKERLRAEEQLLRSSGRALKNQKDHIRIRQSDLKKRRDEWRREWSRLEESIAARKKSESSSSSIGQQRESFSAAKKSLDKEIATLNTVTSQIKESSRWLKHREQKVKELSEAIARASVENEGLFEMTHGPGPTAAANDDATSGHSSCLPSHSTCNSSNSNKSSGEEGGGSSSFASTSVRRILHNLQEDVKELQSRMNRSAVPDPETTPLNEGTQAAAFHAFQQQLPPLPPLYVIPPLAGYTYGFHVPAPPDVLPTASARPRPHQHQHGYYASYPHKQVCRFKWEAYGVALATF